MKKQPTLTSSTVQFEINDKSYEFKIVHNLPETFGLSLENAVDNWICRTKEFTAESLCEYINSKKSGYEASPLQPWHIRFNP